MSRDEIFLATKVAPPTMRAGEKAVRKSIDDSLSRLKTPYLDLLLIHWPVKDCVKFTWKIMESYQKTIPQIVLR